MRMQLLTSIVTLIAVYSLGRVVPEQGLAPEVAACAARDASSVRPKRVALQTELDRIAATTSGRVGLCAIHVQSGELVGVNMNERFPMASTYKVAIAVQLLCRVQHGEVRLDEMIELRP